MLIMYGEGILLTRNEEESVMDQHTDAYTDIHMQIRYKDTRKKERLCVYVVTHGERLPRLSASSNDRIERKEKMYSE